MKGHLHREANRTVRCGNCRRSYVKYKGGALGCGRIECESILHNKHFNSIMLNKLRNGSDGMIGIFDFIRTFHTETILEWWAEAGKPKVDRKVIRKVRASFDQMAEGFESAMKKLEGK